MLLFGEMRVPTSVVPVVWIPGFSIVYREEDISEAKAKCLPVASDTLVDSTLDLFWTFGRANNTLIGFQK